MKRAGLTCLAVALIAAASLTPADAAAIGGPCASEPESRALDFWVGDWQIGVANEHVDATSRVSRELGGCVVVERWDGGGGHVGENMFGYSADDKSWHGMFADSVGHVHVFVNGRVRSGVAEFTGPSLGEHGEAVLNRITIRRTSPEHVQQLWEKSPDGGKTWTTVFDGEYTRKS